jgi:hypothetical protein
MALTFSPDYLTPVNARATNAIIVSMMGGGNVGGFLRR